MVNLLWVKNVMLLQKHSTLISYRIAYLLVVTLQTAAGGICHLSDDSCVICHPSQDIAVMEESERSEFISRLGIEAEEFAEGQERVELEAGEEVLGGQTEDCNAEGVGGLGEAAAEGLKYVCKKCQVL